MAKPSLPISLRYREDVVRTIHKVLPRFYALVESPVVSPSPFFVVNTGVGYGTEEGPLRVQHLVSEKRHARRASDGDIHNGSLQILNGVVFSPLQLFRYVRVTHAVICSVLHHISDAPLCPVIVIKYRRVRGAPLVPQAEAYVHLLLMNHLSPRCTSLDQGPAESAQQSPSDAKSSRPHRSNALIHVGHDAALGAANADT